MSTRDITHAALRWHAVHAQRMALNAERLKLSKEWPKSDSYFGSHPAITRYWAVKIEITAIKVKERAALKVLAKACAQQRSELASTDAVNSDLKLIQFWRSQRFKTDTPPSPARAGFLLFSQPVQAALSARLP